MDNRAQVSFEYLLTVTFGVVLVLAAFVIALQMKALADAAKADILQYRQSTIQTMLR